jgi:hypothetical protein
MIHLYLLYPLEEIKVSWIFIKFCRGQDFAFPAVFVYAENIVCGRDGRQNVSFVRQSVKNCPNAIVKEKRKGD